MPDRHLERLLNRPMTVPPKLLSGAERWRAAGERFVRSLQEATHQKIRPLNDASVSMITRDAAAMRRGWSGTVVPLAIDGEGAGYLSVEPSDAVFLSSLILGEVPPRTQVDEGAAIDGHLIGSLAEELVAAIREAFGVGLAVSGRAATALPPGLSGELFIVGLRCQIEARAVEFSLLLSGSQDAFAIAPVRPAPCPRLGAAVLDACAPVSAVLDSWRASAAEAASLRPGQVIPLPGASLETLDLVLGLPGGAMKLAEAELGKARGRAAVRLTSEVSFG